MSEQEFLTTIKLNQGIIHKICRLYRDSPEDREDLFQEIVYQLWRSYPSFNGGSKISTWLYRIALNTAMASFRKNKPDLNYVEQLPDLQFETAGNDENERQQKMLAAIKQLTEGDRAFVALYLDDLSYRQIADVLGINENNVGVKLNRIKTRLQKLIN